MELDIARGEFFVPAAFFTPPPFSTGEKQCVQNDRKEKTHFEYEKDNDFWSQVLLAFITY